MSMPRTRIRRPRLTRLLVALVVAAIPLSLASPASAAVVWDAEVYQAPTNLAPGEQGMVRLLIANKGDTGASSFPTVTIEAPPGVTLTDAPDGFIGWSCTGSPTVTCTHAFGGFFPVESYSHIGVGGPFLPIHLDAAVDPGAAAGFHPMEIDIVGEGDPVSTSAQLRVGPKLPFGPTPGTFTAGAFDPAGDDYTQAGGHPYVASTSFNLNTRFVEPFDDPDPRAFNSHVTSILAQGAPKDVVVDLPAGFTGDPTAVPECSDLGKVAIERCPPASQVGVASAAPPSASGGQRRMFAVYNVVPESDAPAQFAFKSPVGTVVMTPVLRSDGDMGLSVKVVNITERDPMAITQTTVSIWGVPSDPSHDAQRCARPNFFAQACVGFDEGHAFADDQALYLPNPPGATPRPFLTNPTLCSGNPVVTTAHFSQWGAPAAFEADGDPDLSDPDWVTVTDDAPPVTGCDKLAFSPVIDVRPTTTAPGQPTGLEFDLSVPQNNDVNGLATAHLRDATVSLPQGMTVNPSSANGLKACGSAEIGLVSSSPLRFTKTDPSCPLASKIGTVEVDTALLDEPLTGSVFLARQTDNPFDSLLAMYMVVRGPGILVKLAGHVSADPETGQLTTTVRDNPQVPFDKLRLTLKSGPRAPLTNPRTCGTKTVGASLSSWAGHLVDISDSFTIDCPGNADVFDPGFSAGSTGVVAGSYSPFTMRTTRDAGKDFGRIDTTMPKGLLAKVKGVPVCTNAQIASSAGRSGVLAQGSPSCPVGSQIGTTTVGSGSGPDPFFPAIPGTDVSGRVFLSEPHTGTQFPVPGIPQAKYGLAIEVPAVAGPFDLGTVMIRAAIFVDPNSAQLTVVSDRLPRILQGIPLDMRDVRVNIDRARFTVNPTSCAELQARADIRAQDETLATRTSSYRVGECAALGLAPRTALRLTGRKQTGVGDNPGLRVSLRQGGGQANLRNVKAVLPRTLALDSETVEGDWLCEFEAGQRAACPASSRIGTAKAWSPLLERPLSGPVYFVKHVRIDPRTGARIRTLPTLLIKLRGEVEIHTRARSSVQNGLLVSTFSGLPDARISRFQMNLRGGKQRGVLAVTGKNANLCGGGHPVTRLSYRGQNGKLYEKGVRMATPCKAAKRKKG